MKGVKFVDVPKTNKELFKLKNKLKAGGYYILNASTQEEHNEAYARLHGDKSIIPAIIDDKLAANSLKMFIAFECEYVAVDKRLKFNESLSFKKVTETDKYNIYSVNSSQIIGIKKKRPFIVSITGAVGSGKSTLAERLYFYLSRMGYRVVRGEESAVLVTQEYDNKRVKDIITSIRKSELVTEFQYKVLKTEIDMEENLSKSGADIVIVDDCIFWWLYFNIKHASKYNNAWFDKSMSLFKEACKKKRYDLIILCDYRDIRNPIACAYRSVEDICVEERRAQHKFLHGIIMQSMYDYKLVSGTVEDRLKEAVSAILKKMEDWKNR